MRSYCILYFYYSLFLLLLIVLNQYNTINSKSKSAAISLLIIWSKLLTANSERLQKTLKVRPKATNIVCASGERGQLNSWHQMSLLLIWLISKGSTNKNNTQSHFECKLSLKAVDKGNAIKQTIANCSHPFSSIRTSSLYLRPYFWVTTQNLRGGTQHKWPFSHFTFLVHVWFSIDDFNFLAVISFDCFISLRVNILWSFVPCHRTRTINSITHLFLLHHLSIQTIRERSARPIRVFVKEQLWVS